ncbi:MAG: hypothetical protein PUC57_05230, partial [Oscillospiraceae bacterium]|nr:hypothetical protein [Oscillospiraceae bacterium]
PPPWQGGALPDELNPQLPFYYSQRHTVCQDSFFNFYLSFFYVFCYNNLTALAEIEDFRRLREH